MSFSLAPWFANSTQMKIPELSKGLLEQVGHVQAPVGSEKLLERATAFQTVLVWSSRIGG